MRIKVTLAGQELGIFDPDELTMNEALQLEDRTGMSVIELGAELSRGSAKALQAMVWLVRLTSGKPGELHADFKFKDLETTNLDDVSGDAVDPPAASVKAPRAVKAA